MSNRWLVRDVKNDSHCYHAISRENAIVRPIGATIRQRSCNPIFSCLKKHPSGRYTRDFDLIKKVHFGWERGYSHHPSMLIKTCQGSVSSFPEKKVKLLALSKFLDRHLLINSNTLTLYFLSSKNIVNLISLQSIARRIMGKEGERELKQILHRLAKQIIGGVWLIR